MEQVARDLFGINATAFYVIGIFWAIVCISVCGSNDFSAIPTVILSLGTAWLLGKLGIWLLIVLILVVIAGIVFFFIRISGGGYYPGPPTPVLPALPGGSAVQTIPLYSNLQSVPAAPTRLFHGTSKLKSAKDIVKNNRWLLNNHYPNGVYMAEDFQTSAQYTSRSGGIVEIEVAIPPEMIIDINETPGSSSKILEMGYRLIRNGNIYIAPIPETDSSGKYFRVEGLTPVRLLDNRGRTIPIT